MLTNLLLAILISNGVARVSFPAEPWTFYRLERQLHPSTNWLAADSAEERPYHFPAVLCDRADWNAPIYRVAALEVRQ